ncbi:Fic family protein [Orrella daihaiensis]|uniref:Fic family protein n=1 Tax=Orrella daihaiensis TaxID=2782176 RepID=UPI001FB3BA93|nr:Fic family protein [Orrella daihaiensis]
MPRIASKNPSKQSVDPILNHKAAIEMLFEDADEVDFDAFTFKNLHAVLSQELMRDPTTCGRLRQRLGEISSTVFYPLALPQVIEDCFSLLLAKAAAIPDPFEQAFFLMVQLRYLQPFENVNKCVSRIGTNIPLYKHNLCPLSFVDVPEQAYVEATLGVYELNQVELLRDVFVWAYEGSCQRYPAITQTMVERGPIKIKYREALIQAVQTIVRGLEQPTPAVIEQVAKEHVPGLDREAFREMLVQALRNYMRAVLPASDCGAQSTAHGNTDKLYPKMNKTSVFVNIYRRFV